MINNKICNLKFRDNLTSKIWLFLIFKDYLNVLNTGTTYQEAKNVNNIKSYKDVLQKNKNNLDARVKEIRPQNLLRTLYTQMGNDFQSTNIQVSFSFIILTLQLQRKGSNNDEKCMHSCNYHVKCAWIKFDNEVV